MKREIILRVWHKPTSAFLDLKQGNGSDYLPLTMDLDGGYISRFNAYGLAAPINYSNDDIEVTQYSGVEHLGRKIFEGDIVKIYGVSNSAVVVLGGCFVIQTKDRRKATKNYYLFEIVESPDFQLFGNIFENPDLLTY